MKISTKVYTSPDAYRLQLLSEDRLHAEVSMSIQSGHPFIINGAMGVGKTHALLAYLCSKRWREFCAGVVLFFYTHRQLDEIEARLTNSGLVIRRYPQRDAKRCGDRDAMMTTYESMHLPLLAKSEVCRTCPRQDGCPYRERSQPDWATGADVILAPEQLVGVFPGIIERWTASMNAASGTEKPLLVGFDEVKIADQGFYQTFTAQHLRNEVRAASGARCFDIANFLDALVLHPQQTSGLTIPAPTPHDVIRIQRRGFELFGSRYVSVLELAYAYARRPIWFEDGVYCVVRYPSLPPTTMFLGAFINPSFIERRMNVPTPRVLGDGSVVLHPDSQIINVASAVGFQKYWPSNKAAIINLAADFIARNHAAGRTTVVVGRKNSDEAHA